MTADLGGAGNHKIFFIIYGIEMRFSKSPRASSAACFLIGLGIGVLVAFPLAAPIIGSVIPDGASTMWGSALGASITVAGAYLVAEYQLKKQRRSAASLMYSIFSDPVYKLTQLMETYGSPSSTVRPHEGYEPADLTKQHWTVVIEAAKDFLKSHEISLQQSRRIDSALNALGPKELFSLFSLEAELKSTHEVVAKLLESAIRASRHDPSFPAEWDLRVDVENCHHKARGLLDHFVFVLM